MEIQTLSKLKEEEVMHKPDTQNSDEKMQEMQKIITDNQENKEISNEQLEKISRLKDLEYDNIDTIMKAFEPFENSAKFSVIQNPGEILDPNTKIDKIIIAPITSTNTQKVIYNIFPIKFAPLKGKIRYLNRVTNYVSANPDIQDQKERAIMEQEIINETIIGLSKARQKISESVLRNSKEFQALPKAVNDNLVINKPASSNTKVISYLFNGIPAAVSITPIVVATGPLDIEKSEKMVAKRIENLGLYICTPDKLEWTIEYVLTKNKKAMESPTNTIINQDRQSAYRSTNMIRTSTLMATIGVGLIGLILVFFDMLSTTVYLIAAVATIGLVYILDNIITKRSTKKMPVIRKERDLFKENNEKYLMIHREWMLKNESPEFQNQLIEEFKIVAQEVNFARTQAKIRATDRKQSKKKKKTIYSNSGSATILKIMQALNKQTKQTKPGAQNKANIVKDNVEQADADSEIKIASINQENPEPISNTNSGDEYGQAEEFVMGTNEANEANEAKKPRISGKKLDLSGLDEELIDSINKFLNM